ncbi:MAG: antitoxin PrlF [Thermoanaerobaculia bacterium]|jgi:AbrB family looped-hinge helix DNA binding protein|nr:antitoxin PrlF [Thermoanaerobaculia bacterium]
MPTATVTSKGQVTIPKVVRDLMNLDAGDRIDFVVTDAGDVFVRSASRDISELRGIAKRPRGRAITIEQMNAAVLRQHSRKR